MTKAMATGPGPAATKGPKKKIGTRKIGVKANPTVPAQGAAPTVRRRPHDRLAAKAVNAMTTMGLPTTLPRHARACRICGHTFQPTTLPRHADKTVAQLAVAPTIGNRAVPAEATEATCVEAACLVWAAQCREEAA